MALRIATVGRNESGQRAAVWPDRTTSRRPPYAARPVQRFPVLTDGSLEHMLITMARPIRPRRVCCRFPGRGFRPLGIPARDLPVVTLGLDELEAIRLADRELLYQDAAAERMGVSRQTFARILARGRAAVAESLVDGKLLLVQPATSIVAPADLPVCPVHGGERRRGRGCRCETAAEGGATDGDMPGATG